MQRYAWVLEVRPGYEDEYERRHANIWPELLEEMRRAGQRDYAIFRHGLTLFGTFACDDLQKVYDVMKDSEVFAKWGLFNGHLMKAEIDPTTGYPYMLPLVWEFEG